MPSFEESAQQLSQVRNGLENSRQQLHRAKEQLKELEAAAARLDRVFAPNTLKQIEKEQARLTRIFDPKNETHQERKRVLAALAARHQELKKRKRAVSDRRAALAAEVQEREAGVLRLTLDEARLAKMFVGFSDPRAHVAKRDAAFPFLLFPLRLETRFKRIVLEDATVDELWVRVYPDECLVDTFEATPSEDELKSLRTFWINWARAGGNPEQQRGAWRTLVAGFGSGRAAWLVEQFRPLNPEQLPDKDAAADIILVGAPIAPVPEEERAAVATYWTSVWRAEDEAQALRDAAADLEAALGAQRAAEVIEQFRPENLDEDPPRPHARADVAVQVAFLELPDPAQVASQRQSWSQPPRIYLLPEQLVLLGYRGGEKVLEAIGNPIPSPLIAGPDPLAPAGEQMHLEDGDLVVGPGMRWMVDFDEAVRIGMGFRVPLGPEDVQNGFDRLMVLGVRLSADAGAGKNLVETLLVNHQRGTSGFAILPQGTPTNNTEGAGSGFSESEDADDSFDLVFGTPPPLTPTPDLMTRLDGQWFADMLGVNLSIFERTAYSRGRDQCEARAMNTALWPATWGYFLETMLRPVLDDDAIAKTRWFFTHFVTGRGTIPAIRIGDQPYGILPTTTLSRMSWLEDAEWPTPKGVPHPEGFRSFLGRLDAFLKLVRQDWLQMLEGVSFVGKDGDPHQILLDVVGLTPASVEFYQRYAESLEELTNRLKLQGFGDQFALALLAAEYTQSGMGLLARLGYAGEEIPEILEKFFIQDANKLQGDIIDDQKLSETTPIRAYTADGRNYIRWLIDAAQESFERLRKEDGFTDDKPPTPLLYLLLRYALEQGYWDVGVRLFEEAGVLSQVEAATARLDPSFVHVAAGGAAPPGGAAATADLRTSGKPIHFDRRSESRYDYLYRTEPAITGRDDIVVAEFIPRLLGAHPAARYLDDQLKALAHLEQTPTARLERLLAEHLDLCTYRLDAWRWGLLHYQLAALRYAGDGENGAAKPGTYVGAFGWLESVRSEEKQLTPVTLPADLDAIFNPEGAAPLMRDSTNAGFIHGPSLSHAVTAAILRNGYLSHATPGAPDALAVNLSSARVRTALGVIEGIRNGHKLGALLGYQLERGLHDRHDLAEVDFFIFKLRKAFPLVADHLKDTQTAVDAPIEAIEARNVIDGLALVKHIASTNQTTYPFGKDLPEATSDQAAVINAEVDRIRDIHDALADLAMAEAIYQAVQGNYGRTGAALEAYERGTFPPEPEVVETPRSGINLTHRVGVQLEPGLDSSVSPNALAVTPRARAEPAMNKWLDGLLPVPTRIVCHARFFDPAGQVVREVEVSQADLGLQAIDLLYVLHMEADQAMTELDDRVVHQVMTANGLRPDVEVSIDYARQVTGKFSFFEVGALVQGLRALLLKSRSLTGADISLPNEEKREAEDELFVEESRITAPLATLGALVQDAADDLTDLTAKMDALLGDVALNRNAIIAGVDGWIDRYVGFAARAWEFGITQAGVGFAYAWRRQRFQTLLQRVQGRVSQWQERLDELDALIAGLPGLANDEERFAALRRAERLVSTAFTVPQPASPADYEVVVATKRGQFAAKLGALQALLGTGHTAIKDLLDDVKAELPLSAFDLVPLGVADEEDEMVRFAQDLRANAGQLAVEIIRRRDSAQALVAEAAAAGSSHATAEALTGAAKALFGEDFKIVPEFALSVDQADEWGNAWNDLDVLLSYLREPEPAGEGRDFPVDDWLYGVARVREKLSHWENVTMLTAAFGRREPELQPIQLPYRVDDRWLALPFPQTADLVGERLLYTAHYAVPFDKATRQCGLLLDEWTEVVPAAEETTGITFHYDRPNSEPPQALLLVTSPAMRGPWRWDDLVDALHETLDEARLRAVEPAQVDDTAYARFLPAAIMAAVQQPITIALNLAVNNQVMALAVERPNG